MLNIDDFELLAEYTISAALRQVNDPHVAEEVTQVVFIILARKAHTFRKGTILLGWLLRTTRFTASDVLGAAQMEATSADDLTWEQIAPFLDEALLQLGEKDRNAVALRFFKQKPLVLNSDSHNPHYPHFPTFSDRGLLTALPD